MGSTLTNLVAHIIFGTKNRFPVIAETIEPRLYEYMGGIIRGEGSILLAIGGMPDHIHVLAKIRADQKNICGHNDPAPFQGAAYMNNANRGLKPTALCLHPAGMKKCLPL